MQSFGSLGALVKDDDNIAKITDTCAKENGGSKAPRSEGDGVGFGFEDEYEFLGCFG